MKKTAIELFAGVGGFRVGLNHVKLDKVGNVIEDGNFKFLWVNQWEPDTKCQHAYDCYRMRFDNQDELIINEDISKVNKKNIPDFTLLTAGFPCQDYSVARGITNERGIQGEKGKLWWEINKILKIKKPPFVLLENVDRIVKAPSVQPGRDFAIILRCLNDLHYNVEWRVINAADYGFPQKRIRTFIFAYKKKTEYEKKMKSLSAIDIMLSNGVFATAFAIQNITPKKEVCIKKNQYDTLADISDNFQFDFKNAGYMVDGVISTANVTPKKSKIRPLKSIIYKGNIDEKYYLNDTQIEKIKYLKGAKKIERMSKSGHKYIYAEGPISFPDNIDNPSRTMLTSESSINRSTHVIEDIVNQKYRYLHPIECERLNGFPDNWTNMLPDRARYFLMGNALVTGIIEKIGEVIEKIIECEKE